jgi:hypothetical protein
MRSIEAEFETGGNGLWSIMAKPVTIKGMTIPKVRVDANGKYAELRIYFDTQTWDTAKDGLIYTDKKFLAEAKEYLTRAGYDVSDLTYSEQGKQGDDFVSFDVGDNFIASWTNR